MTRIRTWLIMSFLLLGLFISCSKELSNEVGKIVPPPPSAAFSFKDNTGNCQFYTVNGTYYAGVATGKSDSVELGVIVTKTGSYNLSTDTQNGFFFSDSGTFTSTGLNLIVLKAGGTPILPVTTTFSIKGSDSSSTPCPVKVDVIDSSGWQFNQGMNFYHGYIDTAYAVDSTFGSVPFTILNIVGTTIGGDSLFTVGAAFPGSGTLTPGTYSSTNFASFAFFDRTPNFIYEADPTTVQVETKVTILSYDATTKTLIGEFSGTAKGNSGTVNISNGKFNARLH